MSTKKVAYYYDNEVGNYYYGPGHPMKPNRVRMTHSLLLGYGLYKKMEIYRPTHAKLEDMTRFHADDYIRFLSIVTPENQTENPHLLQRYNLGEDCPVFDGLFNFCQISAGGSIGGAVKLNHGQANIAVNWSGGLHHAKKCEASGFCYVNDIVLAILELLKYHARVLYVDIDIHHGDGVEEAFYTTNRVMTVSFHKYGEYFPGTGDINDIGVGTGKYYSINVPLKDGIDDETYQKIFEPVMKRVMEVYQPGAIVLQCGADSLTGDRLGCFNLTIKGHGRCVEFLAKYNIPMLVLGGGGYTIHNVARCWCYETSILLGEELQDDLPYNEFYEYYQPDAKLHIQPSNMENMNQPKQLEKIVMQIFENLRHIEHVPSVQVHEVPGDLNLLQQQEEEEEDNDDPDIRISKRLEDKIVQRAEEFYDDDNDNDESTEVSIMNTN